MSSIITFTYCSKWNHPIRITLVSVDDERLQTKTKEFTGLVYTGLVVELEHLEIKLRSTSEEFAKAMGERTIQTQW